MTIDDSRSPNHRARSELGEVVAHLKQLQSVVAVAVRALRQQNADIDADVANLLQRSVGDALQRPIDRIEAVVRHLAPTTRPPTARRKR